MTCKHTKRKYLNMGFIKNLDKGLTIGWNCPKCNCSGIDLLKIIETLVLDDKPFKTKSYIHTNNTENLTKTLTKV